MQTLGETTLFGGQMLTPRQKPGDSHSQPDRQGARDSGSECGAAVNDMIFWSWEQFLAKF